MPPSVVSDFPRFFNLPIRPMLPACRIRNLLRSVSSTIFAVFTPRLISWKPSFRPNPPSFSAASAPTTFMTVCTNCGFAWAKSVTFCTTPANLSAAVVTYGKNVFPSTNPRFVTAVFARCILDSALSVAVANAVAAAPDASYICAVLLAKLSACSPANARTAVCASTELNSFANAN